MAKSYAVAIQVEDVVDVEELEALLEEFVARIEEASGGIVEETWAAPLEDEEAGA